MNKSLLILIIPIFSYANDSYQISCLNPVYAYLNGIKNTDLSENEKSGKLIGKSLGINNIIYPVFNESKGITKDLINALKQKSEEYEKHRSWNEPKQGKMFEFLSEKITDNRDFINDKIRSLKKDGSKIILFSHSQGNLYANIACDKLPYNTFENIQIATPASEIKCGSLYTSIHQDEMILELNKKSLSTVKKVVGAKILPPLATNVNQDLPKINTENDYEFHGVDNYFKNPPSLNKIKKDLATTLKNYNTSSDVFESSNTKFNCSNIEDYVNAKIKFSKDEKIRISKKPVQAKKGDLFLISKTDNSTYTVTSESIMSFYFKKFPLFGIFATLIGIWLAGHCLSIGAGVMRRDHEDRLREEEEWRKKNGHH